MNARRVTLALTAVFAACGRSGADRVGTELATRPGDILTDSARLAVDGGEMWYRVIGTGTGLPVILLHGGPGFSSHYLKALEGLGDDRIVVRYDQLGSGKSDVTTDTTLFTIDAFVAQLEALRAHLGLDRVHLYGHSWGTILGVEYYRAHPEHVASLVLGSAALDIPKWEAHARALLAQLPDSMQRIVRVREAEGDFEAADYQAVINEFYGRWVFRNPVVADLDSTFAAVNMGIYSYMQGPSEFTITGTLKQYDATSFLPSIRVPVLFTVGEFDEADPETVRRFASLTPGARVVVIPGAAHITAWDNPQADLEAVRGFLREVDAADR